MNDNLFFKVFSYIRGVLTSFRIGRLVIISQIGRLKIIKKNAEIYIGNRTKLWPGVKLSCVGETQKPAILKIGERCSIGDRTEIHCGERIEIGDEVLISWDCVIMDRDYHGYDGKEKKLPVEIGNKAWIGCRTIILKGVEIGEGAVIGAGSVVTRNVEPYSMYAGNPACFIKKLK